MAQQRLDTAVKGPAPLETVFRELDRAQGREWGVADRQSELTWFRVTASLHVRSGKLPTLSDVVEAIGTGLYGGCVTHRARFTKALSADKDKHTATWLFPFPVGSDQPPDFNYVTTHGRGLSVRFAKEDS
jgi:hypothetical protein